MTAIYKRELRSYFTTPIGYIVLAAFLLFEGIIFVSYYSVGLSENPSILMATSTLLVFVLPFITMRTMSEDRRQKVDQALFTAPISITSIVFGKSLAAITVILMAYIPTLIFEIIFTAHITMNWLLYIYALFGILLLTTALISIGVFVSSLTESSAVAAVLSIVVNLFIMLVPSFASLTGVEFIEKFAAEIDIFSGKLEGFANGMFNFADIVFYLSIAAFFTFLTVRSLEKRRWA